MLLHPADIAKELRSYHFFKSFNNEILCQLSTMIQSKSFKKGEIIIEAGTENYDLFFLRSGVVKVVLGGESIAEFSKPGEVMGEMSVINSSPTSTSIIAEKDCDLFVLHTPDFIHVSPRDKDRLESLLYKVYSVILIDRLAKTNEKARLFEILNRELNEAQRELEKGIGGKVLLLESDKKQQTVIKMAVGGTGVDLTIAKDQADAQELTRENDYDVVICEDSFVNVIQSIYTKNPNQKFVLLTTQGIIANLNTLSGLPFVNNVVSREIEDRNATIRNTLITLQKVLNKEIFGIDKYLSWGVDISSIKIIGSVERHLAKDKMVSELKGKGVRGSILDRVYTVAEEMLMNAVYDAPTDGKGKPLFNYDTRKQEIKLDTHQQSILRYATDGLTLAISVEDPFGSLHKETIWKYLINCYSNQAGNINAGEGKGGAGRGLHQIVENSDVTIFNVKQKIRTEVISIFHLDNTKKECKPTLNYFFVKD